MYFLIISTSRSFCSCCLKGMVEIETARFCPYCKVRFDGTVQTALGDAPINLDLPVYWPYSENFPKYVREAIHLATFYRPHDMAPFEIEFAL